MICAAYRIFAFLELLSEYLQKLRYNVIISLHDQGKVFRIFIDIFYFQCIKMMIADTVALYQIKG